MLKICDELRQAVLQEAIQGKLTEQLPSDGDARDLLKQIAEEKAQLVKNKKIKNDKSLLPIPEEELLDVPENWACVRVGKAFNLQAGKNINSNEISQTNDSNLYPCYGGNGLRGYVKTYNTNGRHPIIGRQGALCGNINIADGNFYATEHAVVVTVFSGMNVDFVALFMKALNFNQYATATAQPGLSVAKIDTVVFPLPPLAEQQRIVAKVEKLMAEIDELEKIEEELISLKKGFPGDMKAALLQEVMQGKLTEQLPSDGDARELLKQIKAEKEKLVKEGKLKKEKPLAEITEDEIPFDIPENWEWARLVNIGILTTGNTPSTTKLEYYGGDIPFISPADITYSGEVSYDTSKKLSNLGKEYARIVLANSTLQVCIGGSIGKACIVDREVAFNQQINAIFPLLCNPCYINRILSSAYFVQTIKDNSTGTATPIINRGQWEQLIIPLPPLAEQERIVAKLDKLLPLVDGLVEE